MQVFWVFVAAAALSAFVMVGCERDAGGDGEVPFEVVADASDPAIARANLEGFPRGAVMPGAEVAVGGVAREPEELAALWQQAGFREPAPDVDDDEALLVLAGGEPSGCPWEVRRVSMAEQDAGGGGELSVRLGTSAPKAQCSNGPWQPRALALTLPAGELASKEHDADRRIDIDAEHPLPLPAPVVTLTPEGPKWDAFRTTPSRYELSEQQGNGPPPPGRLAFGHGHAVGLTSFPAFDVVQLRLDWRKQSPELSARYVQGPPVEVAGDAFLELRMPNTTVAVTGMPRRLEAPPDAAITEIVLVSEEDPLTWIIGVEGAKAPLALWSGTNEGPHFTGWTRVIGLTQPDQ